MTRIQRIRQKIIDRDYYLSSHAEDEMLDDGLERGDVENTILKGRVQKKLSEYGLRHPLSHRRSKKKRAVDPCGLSISGRW